MNAVRIILFLGAATLLAAAAGSRAQGPDDKGAVLVGGFNDVPRQPAQATRPQPTLAAPTLPQAPRMPAERSEFAKNFFPELQSSDVGRVPIKTLADLDEKPDINRDIQITPNVGPWVIFLIGCTGEQGPIQARKYVTELRGNPAYRQPTYVFYYGAEERRKENERVKKLIADQMDFFQKNKIMPDDGFKVRHRTIDVQYAVLIGGYSTQEAAKAELTRLRSLSSGRSPLDPKKVDMEVRYSGELENGKIGGNGSYAHYVNPFTRAFTCRNPTVKAQGDGPKTKEDALRELAELRTLNADEPYSLFNCRKPWTLAVKGFQTPFMMQGMEKPTTSVLGSNGLRQEGKDFAKLSAYNLCEVLRKQKLSPTTSNATLEAYVLHSHVSSIVTIGGFDSLNDPALKSMQELLATKLNEGAFRQIEFFAQPMPMPVPR